jgi:hypothetical protein
MGQRRRPLGRALSGQSRLQDAEVVRNTRVLSHGDQPRSLSLVSTQIRRPSRPETAAVGPELRSDGPR